MSDLEIALVVSVIGVLTWTAALLADGFRTPTLLPGMLLAVSFLTVSWLAIQGDPLVPLFAAFNRGLVAGIGLVVFFDRLHRRRQRQRQRHRER